MKRDEVIHETVESIRKIAAMAAEHLDDESPGATMMALIVTAYSRTVMEYLEAGLITLDEALRNTTTDMKIVHQMLRQVGENDKLDLTS